MMMMMVMMMRIIIMLYNLVVSRNIKLTVRKVYGIVQLLTSVTAVYALQTNKSIKNFLNYFGCDQSPSMGFSGYKPV